MTINEVIRDEKKLAREEGLKEGIEKGEIKKQEETVIKMLENNYSDEQIKTISSVTDEQLEKIKAKFVAVPSGK